MYHSSSVRRGVAGDAYIHIMFIVYVLKFRRKLVAGSARMGSRDSPDEMLLDHSDQGG